MNPFLLEKFDTPFETLPFDKIQNEHYLPAIQTAIQEAKNKIQSINQNIEKPTFENTIEALERCSERLGLIEMAFSNLHHCNTNPEMQEIAKEIAPLTTDFQNDILLDAVLFARIKAVYESKKSLDLNTEQVMLLEKTYKAFVRNGANLDASQKEQLRAIDQEKAQLALTFGDHLLAESQLFELVISHESDLAGLPESVIQMAAALATQKGKMGNWIFTLDYPSYIPFVTYSQKRDLRQQMVFAMSSKGFKGDENDNQTIIKRIAQLRHERANLLGYASHADFVLEERMAQNPQKVEQFLEDLLAVAMPFSEKELTEIREYAHKSDGIETLERWDFAYYSEKLKKEKFGFDEEMLKPYFKLENVIEGVFKVAGKLFGLVFKENTAIPVYHEEVKAYEVRDLNDNFLAILYADFFPRPGSKQNGAWMTVFKGQKMEQGINHRPHISIVCNFTKPLGDTPSLLTWNEVTTLFHEFGHALHGMLANCLYESLSGTNVYWDFVELPSQFFENWVYQKEVLDMFATHYETGEPIPSDLVEKLNQASNYLEAYQTVRQISFGKLDMAWHAQNPAEIENVGAFEQNILAKTNQFPILKGTNMSVSFSHIFSGGYSSGYYSYKWAEVLDADAFEYFKENGLFNVEIAQSFKENILSKGGSEAPMTLYKRFRGQEPSPKALLKRAGLIDK